MDVHWRRLSRRSRRHLADWRAAFVFGLEYNQGRSTARMQYFWVPISHQAAVVVSGLGAAPGALASKRQQHVVDECARYERLLASVSGSWLQLVSCLKARMGRKSPSCSVHGTEARREAAADGWM